MKNYAQSSSFCITSLIGLLSVCLFLTMIVVLNGVFYPFVLLFLTASSLLSLLIVFSLSDIAVAFYEALKSLCFVPVKEKNIAEAIMHASEITYTNSLLSLQKNYLQMYKGYDFWMTGLKLLLDGTSLEQCQKLMQKRMTLSYNRQMNFSSVLNVFAKNLFIFTFLCIGVLFMIEQSINLSLVLQLISYGVVLSFFILKPLSMKLKQNARQVLANSTLCLIGFEAVDSGQNPRKTEEELNALLPQGQQINYFEG